MDTISSVNYLNCYGVPARNRMKISELSARSGLPIPTIKFYIREGLLPPGERTAQNQARYTETHVVLLELARTLKDDLGMSVPTIARIMATDPRRGSEFLDAGLAVIAASRRNYSALDRDSEEYRQAVALAECVFEKLGWHAPANDPGAEDTVAALISILRVWPDMFRIDIVENYARVADEIARNEIPDDWNPDSDPLGAFRYAVLGTYLFEPLILALRRVAHGERSAALASRCDTARTAPPSEKKQRKKTRRKRR